MRLTIEIDDEVIAAAKELAAKQDHLRFGNTGVEGYAANKKGHSSPAGTLGQRFR